MKKISLYTDGGCSENNQREASQREMIAIVSDINGEILSYTRRQGGSNNIAELLAVKEALVWATGHGYEQIDIRSDSRTALAWVAGRIGNGLNDRDAVLELYQTINTLREKIHVDLVWVPRAENLAGQYIESRYGT